MRQRVHPASGALFLCVSAATDGLRAGLLMIPVLGPFISMIFLTPLTFIGFGMAFASRNVGWEERGLVRFGVGFLLGGLPGSTTACTALTLWAVAHDDKRYNEKEREKVAATVRALSNT